MKVTIDIETGGAAFREDADGHLAAVLSQVRDGIKFTGGLEPGALPAAGGKISGSAFDANGNTFARWEVTA